MDGEYVVCRRPIRVNSRQADAVLARRNAPILWIFYSVAPITWDALWHNTAPVAGAHPVKHKFFNN